MPSWNPDWTNVRFDHAAAQQAVDELGRCATMLDDQTTERVRLARTAQQEWRGAARHRFDDELATLTSRAAWLVSNLRSLAADIERSSEAARTEQRRRELDRARWHDERRREEAARAAAGQPARPSTPDRSPVRAF